MSRLDDITRPRVASEADQATLPTRDGAELQRSGVVSPAFDETLPATHSDALAAAGARVGLGPPPELAASRFRVVDDGAYTIQSEIAEGGIGRILLARDEQLERSVAIKEPLEQAPDVEVRFVREALVTARLQHPSIVPVYEAGRWPSGRPFYAMKLVSGRALLDVIAQTRSLDQRLALLPHVIDVAEAMAYAHSEGIIHRDLKPHNILVGSFGETVVIDWGLAKDLRDTAADAHGAPSRAAAEPPAEKALTMVGAILGTPVYMPPEQAAGHSVDERADVYALGAILYCLLAGRAPYEGKTSRQVLDRVLVGPPEPIERRQAGVPRDLVTIVHKAMARDPADRYRTAKELAEDLRRFQTGQIVQAHHYSPSERLVRFIRRYRMLLGSLSAAALAMAIMGALALMRIVEARDDARQERDRATLAEKRSTERADTLTLTEARSAAARNPVEAIAWLKTLSPSFDRPGTARLIAADAISRGIPRLFRGHTAAVNRACFLPDGAHVATSSDDRTVRIWDITTGQARVLQGHRDEVWELSFSPDGKTLASGSKDTTIRLWDLATGDSRELAGHEGPVNCIRYFPDGRRMVSRARSDRVRIWDVDRGQAIALADLPGADEDLAASPDGRTIAYTAAGDLVVFDVEANTSRRWKGQASPASAIVYSPDGKRVVTGDEKGMIRLWDAASGAVQELSGHSARIQSLIFLPAGDARLVSAADDGTIRIWNIRTGQSETLRAHEGKLFALAVAPDGKSLVSGGSDHLAKLWDVASGTSRILRGLTDAPSSAAFSSDGKGVAIASYDQSVRLYELDRLRDRILTVHGAPAGKLAISPDGKHAASAGEDGSVHVTAIEGETTRVLGRHEGQVLDLAFSPDGSRIASAGEDGRIRLFGMSSAAALTFEGHGRPVRRIAFSPDGSQLVSAGADGAVRLWSVDKGTGEALEQRSCEVVAIAFSPDGLRVVSGWQDGVVKLRELRSAQERVLAGHQGPVGILAFSTDARLLASGGMDHTVRLWDAATGQLVRVIDAAGTGIERLIFFPDGKRFATLGGEANTRIWETGSGRLLNVLRGHKGRVLALALSPEGSRIATGGRDGTVRLWDLAIGESRVLEGHQGAIFGLQFALSGRAVISVGHDRTVRRWMDDLPVEGAALRNFIDTVTPETVESLGLHTSAQPPGSPGL